MSAQYVSGQAIQTIQRGTRQISVEFVEKTTAWYRPPGYPSASLKTDFARVAAANAAQFKSEVVKISLKESAHQSDKDKRIHYSAYGLDKDGNVIDTQHIVDTKK